MSSAVGGGALVYYLTLFYVIMGLTVMRQEWGTTKYHWHYPNPWNLSKEATCKIMNIKYCNKDTKCCWCKTAEIRAGQYHPTAELLLQQLYTCASSPTCATSRHKQEQLQTHVDPQMLEMSICVTSLTASSCRKRPTEPRQAERERS